MGISWDTMDGVRAWGERFGGLPVPETLEAMRRFLVGRLRDDPLVRRFVMREPPGSPVRTAADVIGEQRATVMQLAAFPELYPQVEAIDQRTGQPMSQEASCMTLATQLYFATPYFWPHDLRQTATQGRLPPHVLSRSVLPEPFMYWTWPTALERPEMPGLLVDATAILEAGDGFVVVQIGSQDKQPTVLLGMCPYGARYPEDIGHAEPILAMLSFLNSPYTGVVVHRPARAERRELGRAHPDAPVPSAQFVMLRSPEPGTAAGEATGREETEGRDWSRRWLVRGHHRAQWYPSENAHKVIWIAPYVKGPADKPLVPPVYAVVR